MAILAQRIEHKKISVLSGSKRPARYLFLDTETKTKQVKISSDGTILWSGWDEYLYLDKSADFVLHRFKLGVTCFSEYRQGKGFYSNNWKHWSNAQRLCLYIQKKALSGQGLLVIGHNIFFDLQSCDFFYWFTKWGWLLEFYYNKALTYILIIRKGKQRIKLISSTNYFPHSLDKLGELVGVPKLDIDFVTCTTAELLHYCSVDVNIVKLAIQHYLTFLDEHGLGNFCLSRSSQAFTAFRSRFMSHKIYSHSHETARVLEKAAYHGGRVEAGYITKMPKADYVMVDVNSMYPYVMKKYFYPTKLLEYREHLDIDLLPYLLKNRCCIGEVILDTPEPAYCIRYRGKLVFPTGYFTACLCSGGLDYAFKHNHIVAINKICIYQRAKIFIDYVNSFTKLKAYYSKKSNLIMRELAKDFGNHLYGKFAQMKPIITEQYEIDYKGYYREEVFDLVTKQTEIETKMFNKIWVTFGREPATYNFTAVPAHITEYSRLYLYELIQRVGLDNFIYCDTDSLIVREEHLGALKKYIHTHRLGALKIQKRFTELTISGAKYYKAGEKQKIKGIPDKADYLGDYKYEYTQFLGQDSHLRLQVTRFFVTKDVVKEVKPYYDKGKVDKRGKVTRFTLSQS